MLEGIGSPQVGDRNYWAVTLGAYYHFIENFRGGLFYRRQYGVWHDEDWVYSPTLGWHWNDTNQRGEDVLIVDASPRAELEFLPGENWTGELKTRYFYDFFDSQSTFYVRPRLTYFFMRDEQPWIGVYGQVEMYFPLNYGMKTINEAWVYLGAIYHFCPRVQVSAYVARKSQLWSNTPQFQAATGQTYTVQALTTVLGLTAILHFGD